MRQLPGVQPENFAAARCCLQSKISPFGGILKTLSIDENQNGRRAWQALIAASNGFPVPALSNIGAVRKLLSQCTPEGGVLRGITVITVFSNKPCALWRVCYSTRETAKIAKAIKSLKRVVKITTPSLINGPVLKQTIGKINALKDLKVKKDQCRFFYKLRSEKRLLQATQKAFKTNKVQMLAAKLSGAQKVEHQTKFLKKPKVIKEAKASCGRVVEITPTKSSLQSREEKTVEQRTVRKSQYTNFVKREVLHFNKSDSKVKTKQPDMTPNYGVWDIRAICFSMKGFNVQDLKCLSIIESCPGAAVNAQEYASAMFYLKNRCSSIRASHIPRLLEEGLESIGVNREYLSSMKLKGDIFDRVQIIDYSFYTELSNHLLCSH